MDFAQCPTNEELLAFHRGDLAEAQVYAVSRHVERCQRCEAALTLMDQTPDSVIQALRRPGSIATAGSSLSSGSSVLVLAAGESHAFLDPPVDPDELGRLAHYRVLRVLGRGGMGIVFEAEDVKLRRSVALKVVKPDAADGLALRERFVREARATAALRNDHVVTIYEVGQERNVSYLAMELLKGESLDAWLGRGVRPTLSELLRIAREITEGLAAAHDAGLIHRDVKPANVWLEATSDSGSRKAESGTGGLPAAQPPSSGDRPLFRVKLLDFGLAQAMTDDVRLTQPGHVVGTPAYVSPEQARNENVDARADLFSLGCVLYRLATGRMPFRGDTTMALLIALAVDHPTPLAQLNPSLPPAFCQLVEWMLAKTAAHRPSSAHVVIEALTAIDRESGIAQRNLAPVPAVCVSDPQRTQVIGVRPLPLAPTPAPKSLAALKVPAPPPAPARARRLGWLGGTFVATVVVGMAVAAIVFRTPQGERPPDQPPPEAIPRNDSSHGLGPWIESVQQMQGKEQASAVLEKLKERNPGFKETFTPTYYEGEVVELLIDTRHVQDVAPVRALKRLRVLRLGSSDPAAPGPLKDLAPLEGLPLTHLVCANTRVANLEPLRGMPLERLDLERTRVSDLRPLSGSQRLESLSLGRTAISDLRPLARVPLKLLSITGTDVTDLAPLKSIPLRHLDCAGTKVTSLEPLTGKSLDYLTCCGTKITDFSPLAGMPLTYLSGPIEPQRDAKVLRRLPALAQINNVPADKFWKDAGIP